MKKPLLLLIFVITATSLTSSYTVRGSFVAQPGPEPAAFSAEEVLPVEFLIGISQTDALNATIEGNTDGWIEEHHLSVLMELVESDISCAHVMTLRSSIRGNRRSTVGRQALFMIEGFRAGKYPPKLSSMQSKLSVEDARQWWQTRQAGAEN